MLTRWEQEHFIVALDLPAFFLHAFGRMRRRKHRERCLHDDRWIYDVWELGIRVSLVPVAMEGWCVAGVTFRVNV